MANAPVSWRAPSRIGAGEVSATSGRGRRDAVLPAAELAAEERAAAGRCRRTWRSRTSWSGTLRIDGRASRRAPDLARSGGGSTARPPATSRAWSGWPPSRAYSASTSGEQERLGQDPEPVPASRS